MIGVREGAAVADSDPSEFGSEPEQDLVDYRDPAADERDIVITVQVDWSSGDRVADRVDFRIGTHSSDPERLMASARGLGQVALILYRDVAGFSKGEFRSLQLAQFIGRVSADGGLSFPALGVREQEFVDGIDTLAEFEDQAEKTDVRFTRSDGMRRSVPAE